MKKLFVILCVMIMVFGTLGMSEADLWDRGDGLIYDDDLDITWLQDANYAALELTDTRRDAIITAVGTIDGHALTTADFVKSGDNYDGRMTWWGAMAWADQLVYGGYEDWRLPTSMNVNVDPPTGPDNGYNVTGSEMGHMYYIELGNIAGDGGFTNSGPFDNIQPERYASSTEYAPDPIAAWYFDFGSRVGIQTYAGRKYSYRYAWAVRDGDVAPVPEPSIYELKGKCEGGWIIDVLSDSESLRFDCNDKIHEMIALPPDSVELRAYGPDGMECGSYFSNENLKKLNFECEDDEKVKAKFELKRKGDDDDDSDSDSD